MIKTWLSHSFDKVLGSAVAPSEVKNEYELFMAKNETEGLHLSFTSDEAVSDVTVEICGSHSGVSFQTYYETFVPVRGEMYPDPVVPYTGSLSVNTEMPLNVLIEFTATPEAEAGISVYTITAKAGGTVVGVYTIRLKVWDFALPVTSACQSAVGLEKIYIGKAHSLESEDEKVEMFKKYYEMLLNHRLSAYTLPYEMTDPRADAYLSDPRATSYCCNLHQGAYWHMTPEEVAENGKKLKTNPMWMDKAYAYPLDEPRAIEHLDSLKVKAKELTDAFEGLHTVSPFYTNLDYNESTDQIEFMAGVNDIMCPKAVLFEDIYTEEQKQKYPPVYDRMKKFKENGHRIWWYVCNYPQPPYFNVFTNDRGITSRALFWQQYRYEVTGFLYWSTNWWAHLDDPWVDTDTNRNDIHGDGVLFYPGIKVGIDGPVASLRMKIIRDGIEDFDMFTLAEKVLGREYVKEKILSATSLLCEMCVDSDGFHSIRAEIGNALEEALKK